MREFLGSWAADPALADDSVMIDQIQRGVTDYLPPAGDRRLLVLGVIAKRPPRHSSPGDGSTRLGDVLIAIHANDLERFTLKPGNELLLMRDQLHAREAPRRPKVEQDHTAAMFAQAQWLTVQVNACNLRGGSTHGPESKLVQLNLSLVVERLLDPLERVDKFPVELRAYCSNKVSASAWRSSGAFCTTLAKAN